MAISHDRLADRPCSDQFWLAVQYVTGELSADGAAAFELQLEHDTAACEALAEAVILSSTLQQPISPTTSAPRAKLGLPGLAEGTRPTDRTASRLVRTAMLVVCAMALVLVGWYAGGRQATLVDRTETELASADPARESAGPNPASINDPTVGSMLSVWVELDSEREQSDEHSDVEILGLRMMTADAQPDVPDWMFAALLVPNDAEALMPPAAGATMEESL